MRSTALCRTSWLLCALLAWLAAGCGAGGAAGGAPLPAPAGLAGLPRPSELAARAASAGPVVRLTGAQHDPALPPQRVADQAPEAAFDPAFPAGASGHSGLAYALFRFNATGYSGSADLRCGWASPPEAGTAWIGLGSVAGDRWSWRLLPAAGQLVVAGGFAPYTATGGDVLAVLAVTGTANPCRLAYLRLGNEPPLASLLATPTGGALPLEVEFDATGSSDLDGTLAGFELDHGDGLGFQPLQGGTGAFSYGVQGNYTATLRVTDNEGMTALASVLIGAGTPGNQPPVAALAVPATAVPGAVVLLDATASNDPDGALAKYEFDPEGDGTFFADRFDPDGTPQYSQIYSAPGVYHPTVRVTDDSGATATASQALAVGYGSLALRTLDATLGSGPYVNLATADGKLCAAYELGGDLAFVRATTASADAFTPPAMLGELDYGLSLASLGDRLAIAYNSGDKLEFRRANDSAASSWHPAVTVMQSATNKPGAYPALALINGKPAVTGTDSAQLVSWYARAKDSVGDQWHARTVLNSSQKGINGGLIALASGRPAAATVKYQNISQVGVMFCASEDTAGLDWLDPLTVHNSGDFLAYSGGLCLAAGRPALTFHDQTTNKVRFQRAKDAEGAEWNNALAVVTLDLGAKPSTSYLSMATVSGLPAIAYLDGALGLRLVVAKTAVGAAWNPPLTVDAAATGAQWVTLAEFAGRPAIAYADPDGLRLALWR